MNAATPTNQAASTMTAAGRTSSEARPARRRGRPMSRSLVKTLTPWLFLLLPLSLLILLTYLPAANLAYYSMTSWDGVDPTKDFVGLDNYKRMFTDPTMYRVLLVSLYYLAGAFLQMAIALYFATILSFNVKFKNFFKGIIFFPYLINGVAIGFVFLYLFRPDGTLDTLLGALGITDTPQWTGDPKIVNISLAGVSVWRYTGMNFVLFLGAIQSIPGELYEAAELDGANRLRQFFSIILPGIRRVVGLSFILAISGALAVFEIPYIMTGGGNGSKSFVIQTVEMAFNPPRKVGLASAMALVLLLLVLIVTWVQRRLFPDERVDLV